MSSYPWCKKLPRRRSCGYRLFRPVLEALEPRWAPDIRTWSGGDLFSTWGARFNWENGALFPLPPVLEHDSVFFPATADRKENNADITHQAFSDDIYLKNITVAGGYTISGNDLHLIGDIINTAGTNVIHNDLFYRGASFDDEFFAQKIDVQGGLLRLTRGFASTGFEVDVIKTGPGTLETGSVMAKRLRIEDGELVLLAGAGTLLNFNEISIHPEATLELRSDNQIDNEIVIDIDRLGIFDLQGNDEGVAELILTGGRIDTGGGILSLITAGFNGSKPGRVTTNASDVSARIDGGVNLGSATRTFTVADGTVLNDLIINGRIQGTGGLIKNGPGRMELSGPTSNTYTGRTTVNRGTLELDKDSGPAVAGELVIGDGIGGADADVVLLRAGTFQLAFNSAVTVNASGLLSIPTGSQQLGDLTLNGGHVSMPFGTLIVRGDVTVNPVPTAARIDGRLQFQDAVIFTVAEGAQGSDLLVNAVITSGGVVKEGPGTLELTAANTYSGGTVINEGRLEVNGSLTNSRVTLNAGGTLRGDGTVDGILATGGRLQPEGTLTSTDNVTFQSGARFEPELTPLFPDFHERLNVQGTVNLGGATLGLQPSFVPTVQPPVPIFRDDGDAGFTATSGWTHAVADFDAFFADDIHFASPGNGSERATWTFQGLPAGHYRVGAYWQPFADRATNAPYTIRDGNTVRATVSVNQQLTPADFSFGIYGFDILSDVQVNSGTLTIELSNAGNGLHIADVIVIIPHHFTIIDNDGTDAVQGTFANLPEGTQFGVPVTVPGTQLTQTQFYRISYRANDGNDVGLAYVTTATAVENLVVTPTAINEGQKATLTGKLTDPDVGDFLTLTIDWGDGSNVETYHPGLEPFEFSHRYKDNPAGQPHGAYTVHVTWFDQHNAGNKRDLTVTVHNVVPTIFLPANVDVRGNGLLVVAGHFTDPGVNDRWTATVDYGDGAQPLTLNPAQRFLLHHRYKSSGTFRVTVTVTDDDGELATASLLVHVDLRGPRG